MQSEGAVTVSHTPAAALPSVAAVVSGASVSGVVVSAAGAVSGAAVSAVGPVVSAAIVGATVSTLLPPSSLHATTVLHSTAAARITRHLLMRGSVASAGNRIGTGTTGRRQASNGQRYGCGPVMTCRRR
jgi:hypothetical protein